MSKLTPREEQSYLPTEQELSLLFQSGNEVRNQDCIELLYNRKYGEITCPNCGRRAHLICFAEGKAAIRAIHLFCGFQMNPLEDTIFAGTHIPLLSWFKALYLLRETETKVTATKIARTTGVSVVSAGKMKRKLLAILK